MPKLQPMHMRIPARPVETRTFTAEDGRELTLSLRAVGDMGVDAALSLAEDKIKEYVTGGWVDETRGRMPEPKPLHPVYDEDGQAVAIPVNERSCRRVALIYVMQAGDSEDAYTFEDFLYLMVTMPDQMAEVAKWIDELEGNAKKKRVVPSENQPPIASGPVSLTPESSTLSLTV